MLQDEARERKKQLKRELQEKNRAELAKVGQVDGLSLVDCIMVHTYVGLIVHVKYMHLSLSTKNQMLSGIKKKLSP